MTQLADPSYALCGKSKEAALKYKQLGNQCFSNADYVKALDYYTQVLFCFVFI
jgi:SET and MYND domain-containing protein 4